MQPSTFLALIAAFAPFASAVCCWNDEGYCADGTEGTPYCGIGECDWTGCDCKGGCRTGSAAALFTKRENGLSAAEAYKAANTDGTGELTFDQFTNYLGVAKDDKLYADWFDSHDTNDDGVLSKEEILAQ